MADLKDKAALINAGSVEGFIEEGVELAMMDFREFVFNQLPHQTQMDVLVEIKAQIDTTHEKILAFGDKMKDTALLRSARDEAMKSDLAEEIEYLTYKLERLQTMLGCLSQSSV